MIALTAALIQLGYLIVILVPVDLSEYLADHHPPLCSTAGSTSIVALIHALTGPRNCVRSRLI
ncbi:hypothetical protein QA645_07250 [Bradyrhizobium sp. CIAT3101]|uniref:hypothetical protein n=1 Tax=Bradyrhizobium sp. CIAT3101 TaxID=439387 RepID=UPI0024B202AD|nr:hypothetical protein [Bradyrhizobium sp. CIAT3101]WFU82531.1 hypothetical protein QA645_07250 [Bradyrhizobium sp. CIAT3101]